MKFIPGPLAAQLSGKLGGAVASHNRGGPYFRRRAKPVISTTQFSEDIKSTFATVSSAWADLSAAARQAFTLWAANNPITDRIGQKITLDGHATFLRINALQVAAGHALLTLPPTVGPPDGLSSVSCDGIMVSSILLAQFTPSQATTSSLLLLRAAVMTSSARNYTGGKMKLCGFSAAAQVSSFNIATLLADRIGTIQNGEYLHLQLSTYNPNTGLRSLPLTAVAQLSGITP